jgi:phosphotriesterase-related protein
MARVETVRGPIDSSELGPTLMHEHVFVVTPEVQVNLPEPWDPDAQVADAVAKLRELVDIGVRTIVDPTVIGLGRDVATVKKINEQVDINIVVATGIYTYESPPNYFRFRFTPEGGNDPMTDLFVHDITEGIVHTGVKAAFLKCAVDEPGMTPGVERVLRAVAVTNRLTGAPITVHTHPGTQRGSEVARILKEEGVDPASVVLGHSGDSVDADHLQELADMGFVLGMDRFGIGDEAVEQGRVNIVAEMCKRGYSHSMVLSHDTSCQIDWFDHAARAFVLPKWNYTHIHEEVLPALRTAGVTDDQIDDMLVKNPRRYFETRAA